MLQTTPRSSDDVKRRHRSSAVTAHWREELLSAILGANFVLGTVITLGGAKYAYQAGLMQQIVTNLIALSLVAFLWLKRSMAYRLRVGITLCLMTGFGALFLATRGTLGLLYLSAVPILTALLVGLRPASVVLVGLCAGIFGFGYGLNLPTAMRVGTGAPLFEWSMLSLAFLVVTALVTISAGVLLRNLDRAILRDQETQAELRRLAHFDVLTNLPNRRMLTDHIERAVSKSQRSGARGAVLFIDLDNFKNVNDTHGHGVGDQFLQLASTRLQAQVRQSDTLGRLGGDEFVVLLSDLSPDLETAAHIAMTTAEKLRLAMAEPLELDRGSFLSSASIGIAMFPTPGQTTDDLLREADTAMYRAKESGRNRVAFFEIAMQTELQMRIQFEQDLAKALARDELTVAIQSQVDLHGDVVGAELLMRWIHPARGPISPALFIPVAEATGLIVAMGDRVIDQACELLEQLSHANKLITLSVNISPRQFHQPDFVERVKAKLKGREALASSLILEVTESMLITDIDETVARMQELARLGIRFSIDDFGTGYSSLSYLKRLPLYELKIDKAFVQDTPGDLNDTAIVRLVLSMAAELNLKVVAEGVETQAQADFLLKHQCDSLQGFLFSRPQASDAWLASMLAMPQTISPACSHQLAT